MAHTDGPPRMRRRTLLALGGGGALVAGAALVSEARAGGEAGPLGESVAALFGMRADARRTYADLPGRAGRVDVFAPPGPGPFPVLVWNAGSGWRADNGYLGGGDVARGMVPAGYAVAAFSVRSSSQGTFPAQVLDATAAVRWVRQNAQMLAVDPDRIAVGGNSSGGWNALMAGLTGGRDLDRSRVPFPGSEVPEGGHAIPPEDRVQAIVDFFAPVDFLRMNIQMLPGACEEYNRLRRLRHCHLDDHGTKSRMLGVPVMRRPELARLGSPLTHLRPDSPPTLVVHGLADVDVPYGQSRELYDALARRGVPSAFYSVPGAGHDLGMMAEGRGQAQVERTAVPASAVREAISWGAVAAFLDAVMPG